MTPFALDIVVPTKRAPWGGAAGDGDIQLLGYDWHTAAFKLQVRTAKGSTGAALIDLATAAAGSEGISASYDATMADPDTGAVVGGTLIRLQVNEATLTAISWGQTPADEPVTLWYDLLVTPSGQPERQFCSGKFTLYPGVTI